MDLTDIGLSWDEASELASHSTSRWRQRVAQCAFNTGRTQVSGGLSDPIGLGGNMLEL